MSDDDVGAHILAVRRGPGANCSSIGSAVEMLFLSATAGAAILAAVSAALAPSEPKPEGDGAKTGDVKTGDTQAPREGDAAP